VNDSIDGAAINDYIRFLESQFDVLDDCDSFLECAVVTGAWRLRQQLHPGQWKARGLTGDSHMASPGNIEDRVFCRFNNNRHIWN